MADEYTVEQDYSLNILPSKTFGIDWQRGSIKSSLDGLNALKQTIQLIFMTERYKWAIYSWQYGNELVNCIGENKEYVQSEAQRMITDSLINDDRILSVEDFRFSYPDKSSILVSFNVKTIYGDTTEEVTI